MANKKGKRGTNKRFDTRVGGPNPSNRNVGSSKGRAFEQMDQRERYGKIANQARDDKPKTKKDQKKRAADTRGIKNIGK